MVVMENLTRSAVCEIIRLMCLTPTIASRSKSLFVTSPPHSDAQSEPQQDVLIISMYHVHDVPRQVTVQLDICLTKQLNSCT